MDNKKDWLMRQVDSFAEGMGYLLSKQSGNSQSEVAFPQENAKKLPFQKELTSLIAANDTRGAAQRLLKLQYAMPEEQFLQLGTWLLLEMKQDSFPNPLTREMLIDVLNKIN